MQEEKSYPFDLAGKNMGSTTESHLLCQLFFRGVIFPWERAFCCANHSQISAGRFLSGHESREDGGGRCGVGGGGDGDGRRRGEAWLPREL